MSKSAQYRFRGIGSGVLVALSAVVAAGLVSLANAGGLLSSGQWLWKSVSIEVTRTVSSGPYRYLKPAPYANVALYRASDGTPVAQGTTDAYGKLNLTVSSTQLGSRAAVIARYTYSSSTRYWGVALVATSGSLPAVSVNTDRTESDLPKLGLCDTSLRYEANGSPISGAPAVMLALEGNEYGYSLFAPADTALTSTDGYATLQPGNPGGGSDPYQFAVAVWKDGTSYAPGLGIVDSDAALREDGNLLCNYRAGVGAVVKFSGF
ncbi:MAG: hypothetical protein HYV63_06300 [Candidatus Schekmanbacteria bacterium]|nr:hypothetical protein [Candidatus Schekmanbacteria bacterium]